MEVRRYEPPNWFTPAGLRRKRRQIEAKGIPNLRNWRFITVTVDPAFFESELDSYLVAKDQLRRFAESIHQKFGRDVVYCWKLEFQKNGYPHWHFAVSITRKLSFNEMRFLSEAWGLGRVNVRRIEGESLDYFFKYVFKNPRQAGLALPDWFLDYHRPATAEGKPASFERVRFWQASRGFYTGKVAGRVESGEKQSCLVPRPVRERVERAERLLIVIARNRKGGYLRAQVTEFSQTVGKVLNELNLYFLGGFAWSPGVLRYVVQASTLKPLLKCPNNPILQLDRQRLRPRPALLPRPLNPF